MDEAQLTHLAGVLKEIKGFGLSLEADSKDAMRARIVGVAFAPRPGEAYYVPLNHGSLEGPARLSEGTVWKALKPILEDERYEKYGQNLKFHLLILKRAGIALAGLAFDPMVASYLLAPHKSSHDLEDLALDYLNWRMKSHEKLIRGRESRFDEEGITEIANCSCARADAAIQLVSSMKTLLAENELEALFQKIEMPLIEVLAAIESNGFKIDVNLLHGMSLDLEKELANLEARIFDLAKGRFNINSPKQLSEVLFARLGLNPIRKTKTGYSTDIDVLEQLAHVHPLPAQVLQYRSLAKLKSTYVDVLPKLLHSETGRVHTSLNQTVTATGRLSSTEPNLQNIPIRTELGRRIREAFIPEKGSWLLSADYSQIELRILAHLSGDEALIEAFRRDEDVHARTASEIFGVAAEEVSPEMRRMAKTINFGIIYGMSPYGLSTELGVSQAEAKRYIDEYFSHYRGVKAFIEELLKEARASGWVKTILGRRRFIPHIQSRDAASRQLGERMAINTPIQGSAADLIKQAMVSIHRSMRKTGCRAKMILQVHDELVFEVPEEERGEVEALVRREMEGVIHLEVSIRVDIGVGRNWREAHP